ncbi:unnamed protein product [Psylliodes chrysocephalus]|uniref:Uncharacterized protein n=1 Tax=Psylliodes chrysocephalus TaxID=3402493 RepID=A0A9P0CFJ7_9CUCU|nr:unnamed protein product [Psylliodes chrysocephala]
MGISRETVRRALKMHKFHSCKMQLLQELYEDDFDKRIEFCKTMSDQVNANPNLLLNICFSDDILFYIFF